MYSLSSIVCWRRIGLGALRLGSLQFLSAGGGHSSVEAWYSAAHDIAKFLSGFSEIDVHVFVDDVVKSFI